MKPSLSEQLKEARLTLDAQNFENTIKGIGFDTEAFEAGTERMLIKALELLYESTT